MQDYGEKDRNENEITILVAGKTQDQKVIALVHWSRKLGKSRGTQAS